MSTFACFVRSLAFLAAACLGGLAHAQPADLLITNARIVTLDAASGVVQALAVRDGRLLVVGTNAQALAAAGPATRRIDAGGRSIIPGLIDSHMHALRAGLSYATEVSFIDTRSIPEAMGRLREAAQRKEPAAWLIVAGGWTAQQFIEKRKPTMAEIQQAVGDRPAWVQMFYSDLLITPSGMSRLGLPAESAPANMAVERDGNGAATGWYTGNIVGISALFDKLPKPTAQENLAGLRAFFAELNRLGVTAVIDPGGFSLLPSQYAGLLQLWREQKLTVRFAYHLFAQKAGAELAEFQNLTQLLPMGFGDDMLKFNGIGERVTLGMYNNNQPDAATREKFVEVLQWAARNRLSVTVHWQEGESAHQLLDLFEQVNHDTSIADLRWSIAHLDNASQQTLRRMKDLGVGWTMQDMMYLGGDRIVASAGEAAKAMPPIMSALREGVKVGAGTDAHRVASYNPFVALQWMLDGRTAGGLPTRGPEETPSREQALRLYTEGSAWFSFDERRRGTLEVGKLADFSILSQDYFTVPIEQIGRTVSLMTFVGGVAVHVAPPFGE